MGTIQDLLTEVPLSAVMKERVALAEQKYERAEKEVEQLRAKVSELETEITDLRSQVPSPSDASDGLDENFQQVMIYLFRARGDARDVGIMAEHLNLERGVAEYYLDQLGERNLASCGGGNSITGYIYWHLTTNGRAHVVENGLISEQEPAQ